VFLNYSSNYRHPPVGFHHQAFPFPTHRLSSVMISRLSIGTMGMLRLPSSFSFPSVSLGQGTTCACCLFLSLLRGQQVPQVTRSIDLAADRVPAFARVETLGSPVFPCFPFLSLICSRTPTRPPHLALMMLMVLSQLTGTVETPVFTTLTRLYSIPLTVTVYASCQHLC